MYGNTMIGPHKDNFSFYLNESNLSLYGSQGQLKMSILALKLAEIDVFRCVGDFKFTSFFTSLLNFFWCGFNSAEHI